MGSAFVKCKQCKAKYEALAPFINDGALGGIGCASTIHCDPTMNNTWILQGFFGSNKYDMFIFEVIAEEYKVYSYNYCDACITTLTNEGKIKFLRDMDAG